ncbi:MAG: hypothetical protein AB7P37_21390 [Ramlibacter sp.]
MRRRRTADALLGQQVRDARGCTSHGVSVHGYVIIDRFASALQKARPNVSTDTLLAKTLELLKLPGDILGRPAMAWSATNHRATNDICLSQIQNGKWKVVMDHAPVK